jgi:hypothetical protein
MEVSFFKLFLLSKERWKIGDRKEKMSQRRQKVRMRKLVRLCGRGKSERRLKGDKDEKRWDQIVE